jgi:hypothetical protein
VSTDTASKSEKRVQSAVFETKGREKRQLTATTVLPKQYHETDITSITDSSTLKSFQR